MGFRYATIFNRFDGFYQNGNLSLAEIAINTRNYLDLGIEANRRLFLNANGTPNTERSGWPATLDNENYLDSGDAVADFIENVGTASASGFYTEDTGGAALSVSESPFLSSMPPAGGDVLGYGPDTLGYGGDELGYG